MSIANIHININIVNFDDRDRQERLQKYLNNHRGSNVSIKDLIMNDLLCDENKKLLNQLRSFKYHQPKNHQLYIHGYILKKINTRNGNIIIILIRFKVIETNRTFTLYPDVLLPMIKFTIDEIDRFISNFQYKHFRRFDLEGLEKISNRINCQIIYSNICGSIRSYLMLVKTTLVHKTDLVHKLYPRYNCAFHTNQ